MEKKEEKKDDLLTCMASPQVKMTESVTQTAFYEVTDLDTSEVGTSFKN